MSVTHSVTDQYSVKLWREKHEEGPNPPKWYWELIEQTTAPKVVRCGTARDREKAYWAARMAIWMMI